MTTPAEELRAASARLREAAEGTTPAFAAPLANWLDEIAAAAEGWEAARWGNRQDQIAVDGAIAVARAINGGQRTRDGAP